MTIKPIKTKADYRKALKVIESLMSATPSTNATIRLSLER